MARGRNDSVDPLRKLGQENVDCSWKLQSEVDVNLKQFLPALQNLMHNRGHGRAQE